jgi:C-terminal processing protease CtpA/Prc
MKPRYWIPKAAVSATWVGTMFLAAYPALAQNPNTPRTENGLQAEQARLLWNQALIADNDRLALSDLLFTVRNPADELFGASLQPISDALRAQLEIPAGQGLLVTSLRGDGPSAQAGLQQNDILLTLADKPLASTDDLTKQLKAAGKSAVPLKILRGGKPVTIQVRPSYRVTFGLVAEPKTEYYIGVSLEPVDDAFRAQLRLPADQGVIISDVVSGSPAEKAGVKKYDIVLELGGKPVANPDALASQVQTVKDTPTTLKLLRGGKPMTLQVTGAVRKVEVSPSEQKTLTFWEGVRSVPLNVTFRKEGNLGGVSLKLAEQVGAEDLKQRLDNLEKELKALREALDKVSEALKATKRD